MTSEPTTFQSELTNLINRHSQENGSNTPDFILACYLEGCLLTWNTAIRARERWYGRTVAVPSPALPSTTGPSTRHD